MGQHAACRLTFAGRTLEGTAWLETNEVVFRGPERLSIPLKEVTSATADGTRLTVKFGRQTAHFDIGAAAARWADRITHPPSRLDKLGIKPGMTVLARGFRDEAFFGELRARDARILRAVPEEGADVVFFGAERRQALDALAAAAQSLKRDGALWVIRPKGTKAITEAETMAAGKQAGLVDVKVVSFSETHTAEKFVIPRRLR